MSKWLNQNQSQWIWMEPENGPEQQSRGDYSVRRGGHIQTLPNNMSDFDDEDDDYDDGSRFDHTDAMYETVHVQDCGVSDINGLYTKNGYCDDVTKYIKPGMWEGQAVDFMLFRCKLSDNTRRWYISIVPGNSK